MNVADADRTAGAPIDDLMANDERRLALLAAGAAVIDAPWPGELLTLLQQGNWAALAKRLSELAPATHSTTHRDLLQRFIECLPEETLCAHPRVAAWLGVLLVSTDLHAALDAWERAHHAFVQERNSSGRAMVVSGALHAILADARQFERLDPWLERGSSLTSHKRAVTPAIWLRFTSAMTLAVCHREPRSPHLVDHALALNYALRAADVDPMQGVAAAACALNVAAWSGDIANATELDELAQRWIASPEIDVTATAAYYVNRVFFASLVADLEQAQSSYDRLITLTHDARARPMLNAGQLNLAHAYAHHSDWRRANSMLDDVQRTIGAGRAVDWAVFFVLRSWIALGERSAEAALDFSVHALQAAEAGGARRAQGYALLAQATALADTGAVEATCRAALSAKDMLAGFESPLIAFHTACVIAYAHLVGNEPLPASETLRGAFGLGRRHRLFNNLLWVPHMMGRLCDFALQNAIEPDYVRDMVRQRGLRPCPRTSDAWPWRIKIYCLGAFRIVKDNAPLTFKGKAQQRPLDLLKALIAHGGRDVHTTRLADALWGDSDADGAQNTFDSTLHRLRKLLDCDDAVLLSEGKLSLNRDVCWLDTWALDHDDPAQSTSSPDARILQLYRGPFLEKEAEQPWMITYRERLHSRYLRAVRAAGARLEADARWHDAIDLYERVLEVDPSAEVIYVQLMHCYCHNGYRAEALNIYRRCRTTLAALFGLPPPPQVERLHRQIQQR